MSIKAFVRSIYKITIMKVVPVDALADMLRTYDSTKNISPRLMTKFEKTTMLGVRMEQISQGSPSVLNDEELKGLVTIEDIVLKELELRKIPFMVLRTLPSGKQEVYKVEDMIIL